MKSTKAPRERLLQFPVRARHCGPALVLGLLVLACSGSGSDPERMMNQGGNPGMATAGQGGSVAEAGAASGGALASSAGEAGMSASAGSGGEPEAGGAGAPNGMAGAAGEASGGGGGAGGNDFGVTDPGTEGDGNFTVEAPFDTAPETQVSGDTPRGEVIRFNMPDSASEIFGGGRDVAVYLPNGYESGTEVPFMVFMDGIQFGHLARFQPVLDNLIADQEIPRMAGLFVNPGSQRSVEYDTVSDAYLRFTEEEFIPYVKQQLMDGEGIDLVLTDNPEGRGAFGGSSGGSCAFIMGWFGPDKYRRLLTVSGSFRPLQRTDDYPNGAAEFQEHLIAEAELKPLRVFLNAGSNDFGGWAQSNDEMADALAAKGYHYRYVFAQGGGHVDDGAMREYLPDAMRWLWRGYPIQ